MRRRLLFLALLLPLLAAPARFRQSKSTAFSKLIERLSEGGGYFHSDNLVSNETSYLHVLTAFRTLGLKGGAYIGVGPEQSFSYIAEIDPTVAFLIDIRRDNLLLHLLFKAMFAQARSRLEYLGMLYGRPLPPDLPMWTDLDLGSLLDYIDRTGVDSVLHRETHRRLMKEVSDYGVRLTDQDRQTIARFHDEFVFAGLDIRYSNRGRAPRLSFPTARQLYLETDLGGTPSSYLATEDRWRIVRALQRRDRVVPVVGDLSGPTAVRAIAQYLRELKQTVSAFYVSNVEQYIFRQGAFPAFVDNVRALPVGPASILVRSRFGRSYPLPQTATSGLFSRQQAQTFTRFLELAALPDSLTYWNLINDTLEVRAIGTRSR